LVAGADAFTGQTHVISLGVPRKLLDELAA